MDSFKWPSLVRRCFCILLVAAAAALFLFQQFPPAQRSPLQPTSERYRPSLAWVDSVSKAMPVVWGYIQQQHGTEDERIVKGVDAFVRDRFVHGFSQVPMRTNWLLAAFGGLPPLGLNVPVGPDRILAHRRAMCSQQSIVFMELLGRLGINYAAVRFAWPNEDPSSRGHFAVAAQIDGQWRYFDSNLEAIGAPLVRDILNGSAVAATYPAGSWWVEKMQYAAKNGGITIDSFNAHPGPRGYLMQRVTKLISDATPFLLIFAAIMMWPGVMRKVLGRRRTVSRTSVPRP